MRLRRYLLCGVIFAVALMGNVVNANAAPCPTDDEYKSVNFICSVLDKIGAECGMKYDFCGEGGAEIFTGLFTDYPNSAEIKDWNGFGILGNAYQAAGLCLLRDLKWTPMVAVTSIDTSLGDAKITQEIGFLEFKSEILENPEPQQEFLGTLIGYHRATADVPVVGHVDLFTQRFEYTTIYNDLIGSGNTVGLFDVYLSDGLSLTAERMHQDFTATLPSIVVPTPYGPVSVKPQFDFMRRVDLIKAPYTNGNMTSRISNYHSVPPWNQLKDLYGLNEGLNYSTSYIPQKVGTGWISQVALGGRDPDPGKSVWAWAPPVNTWDPNKFPLRPDFQIDTARSATEKNPNGHFGASVMIEYAPTDMLPEAIRNNPFVKLHFGIFVTPQIGVGVTSQFDFWNTEISQWKGYNLIPGQFDNYRGLDIYSGVGIASEVALEAGLDFDLTLKIPLLFKTIEKTLVNVHPRTIVPIYNPAPRYSVSQQRAHAYTQLSVQRCPGCSAFGDYVTLNGSMPNAEEHITECLEKPTEPGEMPPPPTYEPGNPEDLLELVEYPCNICVAWDSYTYYNDRTGREETIPGYLGTLFPATVNDKPKDLLWECTMGKVGCYDMCLYDPDTKTLTVKTSAKEMDDLQYQLTYWEHCY